MCGPARMYAKAPPKPTGGRARGGWVRGCVQALQSELDAAKTRVAALLAGEDVATDAPVEPTGA